MGQTNITSVGRSLRSWRIRNKKTLYAVAKAVNARTETIKRIEDGQAVHSSVFTDYLVYAGLWQELTTE